ncbi:MAG TPA: hypothetical protein VHH36_08535 [Candidatus Thermoplasmatota archaeon]|nr:hypothetical protein [Candidatus Thermoplasmatota archaeon]
MDADPRAVAPPAPEEALRFLADGAVPGLASPTEDERVAFARACLALDAFKEKAWPHLACFVDASNVARRQRVAAHETNAPKARLADLDAAVAALRKLRYVPIVVSDANLFQLLDQPYEWQRRYTQFPHSVAKGRQADSILLHALRRLPEAACVTNDRFSKPDELRDFPDVLADRARFFRHRWEGDAPSFHGDDGRPMPGALRRLARRVAGAR